jgi:hypothetical protein
MPRKRIGIILAFAGIFLIGLALRSPEIVSKNYLFGFDQGRDYLAAYNIAVNHKFTLIGAEAGSGSAGISGLFQGPGYFYLLALMYRVFHGDPYGGNVLMLVGGIATLLIVFITTRKMFGNGMALIALFLVSVAPLIAPQSRFLWAPHLGSVFIVLWLYFLYKIPDRSPLYAFLTVFSAGLLYNFELAVSVPLVIVSCISLFVYKKINRKVIVCALLGILLSYAPMIVFEVRHGFTGVRGAITNATSYHSAQTGAGDPYLISQKKLQFYSNYRDSFIFESGLILPQWYYATLVVVGIISITAIMSSKDKRRKEYLLLLVSTIPVTMLVMLPLRSAVWQYFIFHLQFIYLYIFAYASAIIFSGAVRKKILYVLASLFIVFFFISMGKAAFHRIQTNWTVDYPDYGGKDKILGKKAVIDYVYADAKGLPFSVFEFMPPVYTWPYDYLFLTYAKEKYGYMPTHEKKGTVYLIIEKDPEKPWSYNGWLETVIKDGTVVWERYLKKSDHIVQKREFN